MDNIDLSILQILQKNARIALSEIAQRLNLSIPAVSKRVSKLESSNVILQYTAVLNPDKFEKRLTCYCLIVLKNKEINNCNHFYQFVIEQPGILECHCITGEYEYLLKILTASTKELETLLALLRRKFPVESTSSCVVLSTIKSELSVAPQ